MAAKCLKEDCGHEWNLTKPIESYSGSGPRCPECGTTRVDAGAGEARSATPKPGEQSHPEASNSAGKRREPQQPAQQPQQRRQGGQQAREQAAPPARQETQQQGDDAMLAPQQSEAVGLAAAEVAKSLSSDDPEERAAAQGQALQAAGSAIANLGQHYAQQKIEGARRSKNRAGETLEKASDFVRCPECDGAIKDLPPQGEKFHCPHCRERLIS